MQQRRLDVDALQKVQLASVRRCIAVVLSEACLLLTMTVQDVFCLDMSCCVLYCRERAVTNVVRTCSQTSLYLKTIEYV